MAFKVRALQQQQSGHRLPTCPALVRSSPVTKTCGRRCPLFLAIMLAVAAIPQDSDSKKALLQVCDISSLTIFNVLQEYLKRSRENKEKYDKERLDDYYKRNYKDYFELVEGSSKGKSDDLLTESENEIRNWLKKNKK
ncbi:hypothetical protein AXF42_Ash003147 [Apostasia shenzhenica]|uniref:Uncharacterized protein n=1 Tax=Apostasia shenzhenica TaxID=1088818 RepID=A0A2I0BFA8_9ASPA|nr:hypothetical protein AXF42_Ash003147 [Apostasia shenzhenica]